MATRRATEESAVSQRLDALVEAIRDMRSTMCFRKIEGTWLIAHDQISAPLDLASGKALLDLEP